MIVMRIAIGLLIYGLCSEVRAQDEPDAPAPNASTSIEKLSAREAVRVGNRLLGSGEAPKAIEAYDHAQTLEPEAAEIDFAQGLANYSLKDYQTAREAFEKASFSKRADLSNDALYSLGTTFHAEALESTDDPQASISNLESAMQHYQSVLERQPDHAYAREANLKAGLKWRQVKKMMEQQEQEQQGDSDKDKENQEQNEDQDKQEGDESEQDESEQDDSQSEQDQEQSSQQQKKDSESDQEQQQSSESDEQSDEQQAKAQPADEEEQASREQANRKLREMMQMLRERAKQRRKDTKPLQIQPVEKDW